MARLRLNRNTCAGVLLEALSAHTENETTGGHEMSNSPPKAHLHLEHGVKVTYEKNGAESDYSGDKLIFYQIFFEDDGSPVQKQFLVLDGKTAANLAEFIFWCQSERETPKSRDETFTPHELDPDFSIIK